MESVSGYPSLKPGGFCARSPQRRREKMGINDLTREVIGAAIEVHRTLGPGLLESAYEECLCHELRLRALNFERQKPLPVMFKEVTLDCGYRLDLLVSNSVVVEIKAVEAFLPIYEAQLISTPREVGRMESRAADKFQCQGT
jgi:GxxExxY protein